jgi:uncharacterized protein (DUF427 family)
MTSPRTKLSPDQESVWDYPRPPKLDRVGNHIRIVFNGEVITDSHDAVRVLETSHPPVYYLPQKDIAMDRFKRTAKRSYCEFKGEAQYWTLRLGDKSAANVAWSYRHPSKGFEGLKDHLACYAGPMDACYLDGEKVEPQPGGFYGGWITANIAGPFKGGPGTSGW